MRKIRIINLIFLLILSFYFITFTVFPQSKLNEDNKHLNNVKSSLLDIGKMWTFDYPPVENFQKTYNFKFTRDWFDKARLASLRLPGCSGAFVSEDGLVMTNHHCARGSIEKVTRTGERFLETGFYAKTLDEERRVSGLSFDHLELLVDVTKDVQQAFENGTSDEDKINNRQKKITEIIKDYQLRTGLVCEIVKFYNGGKYSLYGYKKFNDIRLVFAPETNLGFFGGDFDNFTYPRYDFDISFFRIYDENGKPLKAKNFFKWSRGGVQEGDAVFVIGSPGGTNRLSTFAQLGFYRDFSFKYNFDYLNNMIRIYSDLIKKYPGKKINYQNSMFGYSNSQKVYEGILKGLDDPFLMAKKRDFENNFRTSVISSPDLKSKYSSLWDEISEIQNKKAKLFGEYVAFNYKSRYSPFILSLAANIVDYAYQMKLDENSRDPKYKNDSLKQFRDKVFPQGDELEIENESMKFYFNYLISALGEKNKDLNELLQGQPLEKAVDNLMKNTILTNKEKVLDLLSKPPDRILTSADAIISFVDKTKNMAKEALDNYNNLLSLENAKVQMLGMALYDVYGTSIPPDGTGTPRVSDGVVKSYEYNGTIAPPITTFYGLYDRFYSFGKQEPWSLPDRWLKASSALKMSTPFNFVSTSDTYGGNSGSPIVNLNLEIVGINFDRNIEGMPRAFIYTDDRARNVGVHSEGILEALKDIYNSDRLVNELKEGKIVN